jgi:transposase
MVRGYHAQSDTITSFATRHGVCPKTLSAWVASDFQLRPVEEQDHLKRIADLERENRELRMEREILKKATAFFAKENR